MHSKNQKRRASATSRRSRISLATSPLVFVRAWILLLAICLSGWLCYFRGFDAGVAHVEENYEIRLEGLQESMRDNFAGICSVMEEQYAPKIVEKEQIEAEAEAVARVLYGMRDNSELDLRMVCWVIINRVESPVYPSTIQEVCQQPSQWVGYNSENPVTEELYELALTELETWKSDGHRLLAKDFLWFDWSPSSITPKNEF